MKLRRINNPLILFAVMLADGIFPSHAYAGPAVLQPGHGGHVARPHRHVAPAFPRRPAGGVVSRSDAAGVSQWLQYDRPTPRHLV